jgi:hypothetical protein
VLRVITQNTPTTFYYGATERYGIEYELARAFADHIGVRLELTTAEQLGDIYPALENGDAHIGAAGLLQSELFRDEIVFGPGYQSVSANVIYRMGEKRPDSLQELAGSSLEVRAGSSYAYLLRDTARDLPELGFAENPSASAETLMRRVADGTVDFAIVELFEEFKKLSPGAWHPAVITHPVTGAEMLYVSSGFTTAVSGMTHEQHTAFLKRLCGFVEQERFIHAQDWRIGDVLLWDNRTFIHHASSVPPGEPSRSYRISLNDGLPFYVGHETAFELAS